MSSSAINFASPAAAAMTNATPQPAAAASPTDLANQNVFLQLLVAQLKNQDPDNPADGTQFVTQLAQFSELSNSTAELTNTAQMSSDLSAIRQALTAQTGATQATPHPPLAALSNP